MGALSALKHKAPAKYGNELICQLQSLQIPVCMYVPHTHTHTHWQRNKLFICANILNCKIVCGQIVLQPASFFCCPRTNTHAYTHSYIRAQPAFFCDFIFRWPQQNRVVYGFHVVLFTVVAMCLPSLPLFAAAFLIWCLSIWLCLCPHNNRTNTPGKGRARASGKGVRTPTCAHKYAMLNFHCQLHDCLLAV